MFKSDTRKMVKIVKNYVKFYRSLEMIGETFQKCKKQLVKFWGLRNKGKNYPKNKKQNYAKFGKR